MQIIIDKGNHSLGARRDSSLWLAPSQLAKLISCRTASTGMNNYADCLLARCRPSLIRQPHGARAAGTARTYVRIAGYSTGR